MTPDSAEAPDEPADATAPQSRRALRWGGIAAALSALAVAALLILGGSRGSFRSALTDALEPLVAVNRGLTGAVLSLDTESSPGDALARYYSAADATNDFDGALRELPPAGSGDARLKADSRRLSDYQATYLRYVIAFLTGNQTQRHEEEFGSVSARLVRTLRRLEDLVPGAHDSVRGAQRLKQWAVGALGSAPDAPRADGPAGADGGETGNESAPSARSGGPATSAPQARFAGNASRTVASGASVPVGVTAVDAKGRRLPVKCDRDTVTVTNVALTVTCTAFWPDGRTRSTSFSISPRTAPKGPATSPPDLTPPATDPPAGKDRPATEGAPTDGTTTEGATTGVRPRPEARPRATATEPSLGPRPRARLAALRASAVLEG